jgi:hypothetical protein|tara:strand:+ start:283 stop:393 length:111 start_codon:yes stop_codon:yes gene_type:complete
MTAIAAVTSVAIGVIAGWWFKDSKVSLLIITAFMGA